MKYILILVFLLSGCAVNKSLKYPYEQTLARNNIEMSIRPGNIGGTNGVTFNTEIKYK